MKKRHIHSVTDPLNLLTDPRGIVAAEARDALEQPTQPERESTNGMRCMICRQPVYQSGSSWFHDNPDPSLAIIARKVEPVI